ncbi:MAG: ABC transporter permease subunit [Oscillospiraceae bacterium]|jgi:ABC-2 type transport system permease protein|nr:ABC transporter permease subunit [Oscillospiraceae bacterium]
MVKLLRAGFSRLWRNKIFWFCVVLMVLGTAIAGCGLVSGLINVLHIDNFYFAYGIFIGQVCALFTGLFLAPEYADGVIRNKLVIGHSRTGVYLANLTVSFTATLIMLAVWLLGTLGAVYARGGFSIGTNQVLLLIFLSILFTAAFTAIFTMIAMLCPSKSMTAVASVMTFLVLFVFCGMIYSGLQEPEMIDGLLMTVEGMQWSEPHPNPQYIGGWQRSAYLFIMDFLPTGQGIQLSNMDVTHPLRMAICSVFVTAITTFEGAAAFKRKDIR